MKEYILDKYDFKKYLLNELRDTRQEDLIFWKSKVPMHVDLIYDLFEKRGLLFNLYINHIGAAFLYSWIMREEGKEWEILLADQPTSKNDKMHIAVKFKQYATSSGVSGLLIELSELFLLENFTVDEEALAVALCHQGKKYERLFIPKSIRDRISLLFPELLHNMALKNWDMFSNVVADELNIYRMGFADAFSGIFNKLIEYVLTDEGKSKKGYSNASGFKIAQEIEPTDLRTTITYGLVQDGSIWEPVFRDAKTSFILNKMHPLANRIKNAGPETEEIIAWLLTVMAEKENEMIRPNDKRLIEIFRQDVSREIRVQAEYVQSS
jgi:hypothetical protein